MTKKILSLLLLTAAFTACNNEENLQITVNKKPLSVQIKNETYSRSLVETTTLPDASQIGVTLVDNSGTTYDGNTYNNLLYTLSGTEWTTENTPMLSATAGKAVAYYPYSNAVTDVTAIPVTSDTQTDYMYSGWVTGLHNTNPAAEFTMKHALSAVRIAVKKDAQYASEAVVTDAQIQSLAFCKNATLDATTGTLNALTEDNQTLNREDVNLTLTTTAQNIDFLVVPGTTKEPIDFILTIGEKQYKATATTAEGLKQGMIHTFTLTLKPTGLVVSSVDVTPWGEELKAEEEMQAYYPKESIVYAVRKNDEAYIKLDDIDTGNEEYIAVALVVTGKNFKQEFWIEKYADGVQTLESRTAAYEAENMSTWYIGYLFYWGPDYEDADAYNPSMTEEEKRQKSEIEEITNYEYSGPGTRDYITFLPLPDGSYPYENTENISGDYTTWTEGAVSDFNGKENTKYIIEAGIDETDWFKSVPKMGTWCLTFNQTAAENQGYSDWYIPSLGQLALMYLNKDKINEILVAIGGTEMVNGYWSSTEYGGFNSWYISFDDGRVVNTSKSGKCPVRFIRDAE